MTTGDNTRIVHGISCYQVKGLDGISIGSQLLLKRKSYIRFPLVQHPSLDSLQQDIE